MAKRSRRDSYGNHDPRDDEYNNYDSYRPRSPPHLKNPYGNSYNSRPHVPTTKTWVNPNLKAKPSPSSRDYPSNRYNDSGNFREDSRSNFPNDRSFHSRSPRHKSPPSPLSPSPPPSRRPSDQVSYHSTSDSRPILASSKHAFTIPPSGTQKERNHSESENGFQPGSSPGFNIRGRSSLPSKQAENLDVVPCSDADLATMGSKNAPPKQPNGTHASATKPTKDIHSQLELMTKHLSQFAQTLSMTASLTNEQEAIEAKLAKVKEERERWRKYQSSYASLSEDQEKEIKDYHAALSRIKDKQRKHHEVQENAIRLMATTLLATGSNDPLPQLDGRRTVDTVSKRLESLEAEVSTTIATITGAAESNSWETKNKLAEIEKAQQTMEADLQSLKLENSESQNSSSRHIEDKIIELDSRLSNIDISSAIAKEFGDVGIEVKALRSHLDDISKIQAAQESMGRKLQDVEGGIKDYKLHKPTFDDLVEKHETLSKRFHQLNAEVAGDDQENPSLFAVLEEFEKNLQAANNEIQQVHVSITTVQDDMEEFRKTASTLDPPGGSASFRPKPQQSEDSISTLSQRLDQLDAALEENLATIRKEAELKDELVAEEVEGINLRITSLSNDGNFLRTALDKLECMIGLHPSKPDTTTYTTNGFSSNEINGVSHSHQQHTSTHILGSAQSSINGTLTDHGSMLESHHNFIADLQSKFNNLTSDELATKMAAQMQKMYPFASTVQHDIVGMNQTLNNLQQGLSHVGRAAFNLEAQANQRAKWDMETRNVVESVRNDLTALQTTVTSVAETAAAHTIRIEGHETKLAVQEVDVAKFSRAFENVKSEAEQQLANLNESIETLEKKLATVETDTRKETGKMHSKVQIMWKERPKETTKLASPIGTSPKSGSPTASPSAPPSPRRVLHMRKKDRSDGKVEEGDMPEEEPSKKRARLEE